MTTPKRDLQRARAARSVALLAIATLGVAGCSSFDSRGWNGNPHAAYTGDYATATVPRAVYAQEVQTGLAAWDGDPSAPGMTAAHPSLPLGSLARITNSATSASVTVRINRRLVPGKGRAVELSRDAAAQIGALQSGPAIVTIEPLSAGQATPAERAAAALPAPAPVPRPAVAPAYSPSVSTASISTGGAGAAAPASFSAPTSYGSTTAYSAPRYLQVGSYRDPANAHRMKARIEREGLASGGYGGAHVMTTVIGGVAYHRVRVGPIARVEDGERALRQARALGHNDARLLRP